MNNLKQELLENIKAADSLVSQSKGTSDFHSDKDYLDAIDKALDNISNAVKESLKKISKSGVRNINIGIHPYYPTPMVSVIANVHDNQTWKRLKDLSALPEETKEGMSLDENIILPNYFSEYCYGDRDKRHVVVRKIEESLKTSLRSEGISVMFYQEPYAYNLNVEI